MTKRVINYIEKHGYKISDSLFELVSKNVLPGTGVNEGEFWQGLADIFDEFMPQNQALLATRETLQQQIDDWHLRHQSSANKQGFKQADYEAFLKDIGYLVEEGEDFSITTENVDDEVASIAGPQLVVPVMNARFALNAANARWGSLYDALYGTDVISEDDGAEKTAAYNPKRGAKVQAFAKQFLDQHLPLKEASHTDVTSYQIVEQRLAVTLKNGTTTSLKDNSLFAGFTGSQAQPNTVLFRHHGLHIEVAIDRENLIGKTDSAGVKDVILESALSTIQDCEDSIAAVDSQDKTDVYNNWLGLMKGDLSESLTKNGKTLVRQLNPDREYTTPDGKAFSLPGRSLLFVRNVGHLMTTNTVLTKTGEEVPEGILDGIITSLISMHDLNGNSAFKNSRKGSIYIVKPKMHGPEEVAFSDALFARIEEKLGLAKNTIKMGIMDEERRTSANLKACIRAAKHRVAFINTGFLDRTGDEIHTAMLAGPMAQKELMKDEKWISAYENRNVTIGLHAGLQGKAQIGKGMWAIPDEMSSMLSNKIGHPKSGANCAWVPSPTAATLHVMHYHQINVFDIQNSILENSLGANSSLANKKQSDNSQLTDLLTIPLLKNAQALSAADIQHELDNNVQGLLGYVVRWVDQGIGCSKVPDIDNVGRMEDRATLRISSQHICNWLIHKLLTKEQVMDSLRRMAKVVDEQNKADQHYQAMSSNFDSSIAFKAACDLIFDGKEQPSGYTEPLLHQSRQQVKMQ